MEEAKGLTVNNQQNHSKCGSVKHLRISQKDCPVGLAIRKAKKSALDTMPSKLEANKAVEDAVAEEERKFLAEEAAGKGGKSDEGASAGYVVSVEKVGFCIGWLDCIGCIVRLDRIVLLYRWISLYCWILMYFWISLELDRIGWIRLDNNGCMQGWDEWDIWDFMHQQQCR